MRSTLLHALFPTVRAEILRLLFTNARQELYVRQLARESFLALHTVQDELEKLHAARIIVSRSNGYFRFYRANPTHPLYLSFRRIVIKSGSIKKPAIRTKQRKKRRAALPARSGPRIQSRLPKPFFVMRSSARRKR